MKRPATLALAALLALVPVMAASDAWAQQRSTRAPAKLTIAKAANPYAAKAKAAKQTVKLAKVKKAKQVLANNFKVTKKAQGKVTYVNAKTNAKTKKWAVNKATGKVTVPKGTAKGTYTVIISVKAAGNSSTISGTAPLTRSSTSSNVGIISSVPCRRKFQRSWASRSSTFPS